MHLLRKLIQKNLDENFTKQTDDVIIQTFNTYPSSKIGEGGEYYLTLRHLRTLQLIIKSKIESCIELEDEKFSIAGGSILTLLMYSSPFLIRDIDLFPFSQEDYDKLKIKLDATAKKQSAEIYENGNSRTYHLKNGSIDLVKKFYPSTKDCIAAFDLNVCKVGFDASNNFYFYKMVALDSIFNFRLDITKEVTKENGYVSLRRIMKYASKGFEIGKQRLMEIYASIASGELSYTDDRETNFFGEVNKVQNPKWKEKYDEAFKQHTEGYHHLADQPIPAPISDDDDFGFMGPKKSSFPGGTDLF